MLGFGPIFIFLNSIPFLMGNKEAREGEGGGGNSLGYCLNASCL